MIMGMDTIAGIAMITITMDPIIMDPIIMDLIPMGIVMITGTIIPIIIRREALLGS